MAPVRHEYVKDEHAWEELALLWEEANFLQSFEWGEFERALGKEVVRVVFFQGNKPVAIAQGVVERARRGAYLAVAGGPVLDWSNEALCLEVLHTLRGVALEHQCRFIRFRPQALDTQETRKLASRAGALRSPMHLTADLTLQLDLTLSEDELLKQMRKNTRSDIRKAERVGVRVEMSQNPADIQRFYDVQLAVARRHGFVPFSYEFLFEQFRVFAAKDRAVLIRTLHEDQLLAEAFVLFFNREAVYHYGISTDANRKLPGAHVGQWAAIREAKKRGCTRYNFWGVAPKDSSNHRFAGVSLFKRGFGGTEVAYLPAHDIPLNWRYWGTYIFELLRRRARHLD